MHHDTIAPKTLCTTDSVLVFGSYVHAAGWYQQTYTSAQGCDSTAYCQVLDNRTAETVALSICAGDSVMAGGMWQHSAGQYIDTLSAQNGCDSVRTINLSILPVHHDTIAPKTLCTTDSILVFGSYVHAAGWYQQTYTSAQGCDSIVYC